VDLAKLYNLFARDLFGFIAPGAAVYFAVFVGRAPNLETALGDLGRVSTLTWAALAVISYLTGLAIQGLAFDCIGRLLAVMWAPSQHPWVPSYHRLASRTEFTQRVFDVRRALASLHLRNSEFEARLHHQHERFIVLKQAAGNGAFAVLAAVIVYISLRLSRIGAVSYVWLVFAVAAFAGLYAMQLHNRDQQDSLERLILDTSRQETSNRENA